MRNIIKYKKLEIIKFIKTEIEMEHEFFTDTFKGEAIRHDIYGECKLIDKYIHPKDGFVNLYLSECIIKDEDYEELAKRIYTDINKILSDEVRNGLRTIRMNSNIYAYNPRKLFSDMQYIFSRINTICSQNGFNDIYASMRDQNSIGNVLHVFGIECLHNNDIIINFFVFIYTKVVERLDEDEKDVAEEIVYEVDKYLNIDF